MAGLFIDPAESFSRALNQGLQTFKSYRDEERLDADRAFQKRMALAAENRAVDLHNMAKTTFSNQQEDRQYDIENLRPLRLKKANQDVEMGGLQIEGQKTQNKINEVNLQYLPEEKEAAIAQVRSGTAVNDAQARHIKNQEYREQTDWNDGRAARDFVSIYQSGNYGGSDSLVGTRFDPLKMIGAITKAPTLGLYLQNPSKLGGADDNTQRIALQFANTNIGTNDSKRFGFKLGTAAIVDLQPGSKGFIGARVVGVDAKTGRLKTTYMQFDPRKLFDKGNVMARTFQMIGNDPRARANVVQMVKSAHPNTYKALVGSPDVAVQANIQSLAAELTAQRKSDNPDMGRIQQIQDEIRALQVGDDQAVEKALFQQMGNVGQQYGQPPVLAAFNAIRDKKPHLNNDQISAQIDGFVANAMKSPQNYTAVLSKAGLKPRRNAKGQILMSEADVLKALSYF